MISGLAQAAQALQDREIHKLAERAALFIKKNMYKEDSSTLIRSYREGASNIEGFLDDYAFLIQGLLDLYESQPNDSWIEWADELQKRQDDVFYDTKNSGYFGVAETDKSILLRMKDGKYLAKYEMEWSKNWFVSFLNRKRWGRTIWVQYPKHNSVNYQVY